MSTIEQEVTEVDTDKLMQFVFRAVEEVGATLNTALVVMGDRLGLYRAMAGAGPLAIREVARRVGRDVKSVHGDVSALLQAGVIERTEDGRVVFPYDEIHVDFVLRAA